MTTFIGGEIEAFIREADRKGEWIKTEYEFKRDPAFYLSVWSLAKDRIDHDLLARFTLDAVRAVRTLRWCRFNGGRQLKINLRLTPFEKRWCTEEKQIGREHVNSGMTTTRATEIVIDIWRKQEVAKVLTHELLHAHDLDRLVEGLPERFVHEHEALIEAAARLIHCYLIGGAGQGWKSCLKAELVWCRSLVQKLRGAAWTTDTWVWSYYFVCCTLLNNHVAFIRWLFKAPRQKTVAQMRAEWPTLRDQSWTKMFGRARETDRDFIKGEGKNSTCFSLAMAENMITFQK